MRSFDFFYPKSAQACLTLVMRNRVLLLKILKTALFSKFNLFSKCLIILTVFALCLQLFLTHKGTLKAVRKTSSLVSLRKNGHQ